jgi:hypothetical protein
MATIGTLLIELSANVARLENDLGRASMHVRNTERMIQQSVNRMNGFFGLLGVTLSGAAMVGFVKTSIDAADRLDELSQITGTSVEALAGLDYAAKQNGASLETVARGGQKLSAQLSDKPELFRKLGISATDSTEAMIQLADVFAGMPDGMEKSALSAKLFGDKLGGEMILFLNQGTAAMRENIAMGREYNPVTTESARRAAEFNDNLDRLRASAGQVGMEMANGILPMMLNTVGAINDLSQAGRDFLPIGSAIGTVFETVVVLGANAGYVFKQVGNEIGGIAAQLAALATGDFSGAVAIGRMMKEDAAAARRDIDAFSERVINGRPSSPVIAETKKDDGTGRKLLGALGGGGSGSTGKSAAEKLREQELAALDSLRRQADGYAKLSEVEQLRYDIAAGKYKGFEADKLREMELLAQQIDLNKSNEELKRYTDKLDERAAARATQRAEEESKAISDAREKELKRTQQVLDNFKDNIQRNFGDVLYNGLNGNFKDIGDGFKQMLLRMAADAAAAKIAESIFGSGAGGSSTMGGIAGSVSSSVGGWFKDLFSFEGGGYTGGGSRSGGIDGIGGFPAILHPDETVIDHVKGGGMGGAQVSVQTSFSPVIHAAPGTDTGAILSAVRQLMPAFIAENKRAVVGAVNQALVSRGQQPIRA